MTTPTRPDLPPKSVCDECGKTTSELLLTAGTQLRCFECAQRRVGEGPDQARRPGRRTASPVGLAFLFLIAGVAVCLISYQLASQMAAFSKVSRYYPAVETLHSIHEAQQAYRGCPQPATERVTCGPAQKSTRWAGSLRELQGAGLLGEETGKPCGVDYTYEVHRTDTGWYAVAYPTKVGAPSFFIDQSGELRWSQDAVASAQSPLFKVPCGRRCGMVRH